jgi:hypothetical protein
MTRNAVAVITYYCLKGTTLKNFSIFALAITSALALSINAPVKAQGLLGQPMQLTFLGDGYPYFSVQTKVVTAGGTWFDIPLQTSRFETAGGIVTVDGIATVEVLPYQIITTYQPIDLLPSYDDFFSYSDWTLLAEVGPDPLQIHSMTLDLSLSTPGASGVGWGATWFDEEPIYYPQSIPPPGLWKWVWDINGYTPPVTPVTPTTPEPGAVAILGSIALSGAAFLRRRRAR